MSVVASLCLASFFGLLAQSEAIVGLPCEGCDAVFVGMPESIGSTARIAPVGEKGVPMVLEGVVKDSAGKPAAGIIVYAYHTDATGHYPIGKWFGDARRHGKLRGWAKSDAAGHYRFDTIRPAGYPESNIPEHVHMHVIEPGRCTYYIDEVQFEDDPRLEASHEKPAASPRGGSGLVMPRRDEKGTWHATRDIVLGAGISDYERCSRSGRAAM